MGSPGIRLRYLMRERKNLKKKARLIPNPALFLLREINSPTLRIPTIQTRRTPIHDDDGVRVALVAQRGAGGECAGIVG